MFEPFGSVRLRAAAGATLVVAVALVAAGLLLVQVLRTSLVDRAALRAEVQARTTAASQAALNGRFGQVDLPDDERVVQIVDSAGTVLAGETASGRAPVADYDPAPPAPAAPATAATAATDGADGVDDHDDDDDDGDDIGGDGGDDDGDDGDADDDERRGPPPRGEVGSDVEQRTLVRDVGGTSLRYRFAAVHATTNDGRTFTVYAGIPLSDAEATVDRVRRAMLFGLPPLLLVTGAATWLTTRRALRPVEGIRAEMAEITGSRDLSRRVPQPASRDEIARLARTTNATLTALEDSVRRQQRFVADASHELRSPIASLRTQLEVAGAHPDLLDTGGVLDDVIRLQHLAADLLLLARLDTGEPPAAARFDLAAVVRREVARRPSSDRITPAVRIADGVRAQVAGSRGQLARVLGNLLDNAQRHARTSITVDLRREADRAVLTVADDGPGVPAAERERVFERFVRLDDARSRDDGGAGLGLAIARDVVRRHGGTLTVADSPTGGAVFEAALPTVRDS